MNINCKKIFYLIILNTLIIFGCNKSPGTTSQEYSAKEIKTFFLGDTQGIIDNEQNTITVKLPYNSNPENLAIKYTMSGSEFKIGEVEILNGSMGVIFRGQNSFDCKVFASDGTLKTYKLIIQIAFNPENFITSFSVPYATSDDEIRGVINNIGTNQGTIRVILPYGDRRRIFTPKFEYSEQAKVSVRGTIQESETTEYNFVPNPTDPLEFVVTAQNGNIRTYQVTVVEALASSKEMFNFSVDGINPTTITSDSVSVEIPYGRARSALPVSFDFVGTNVKVNGVVKTTGSIFDFSNGPVVFIVYAVDGTPKSYTVNVTNRAAGTGNLITSFSIPLTDQNQIITAVSIDNMNNAISVILPSGTSLQNLRPIIRASAGATVQVRQSGTGTTYVNVPFDAANGYYQESSSRNFSTNNFEYKVTAENSASNTKTYNVTVSAPSNANEIFNFNINGMLSATNPIPNTINIVMPYNTDLTRSLTTNFSSSTGSSVTVGGSPISSGASINYRNQPVEFNVTAVNGAIRTYSVNVTNNTASAENSMVEFGIELSSPTRIMPGVINGNNITVTLPFGQVRSSLKAKFISSAGSIVSVNDATITSPDSGRNFTNSVNYKVTAENGSINTYNVTVGNYNSNANEMLNFRIPGMVSSTYSGPNQNGEYQIDVKMPYGTNRSSLRPLFELTGASVTAEGYANNIASGGTVGINFTGATSTVKFSVSAADANIPNRIYNVTVTNAAARTDNSILSFSIINSAPVSTTTNGLFGANNTINVTMPYRHSLLALSPIIRASAGATVQVRQSGTVTYVNVPYDAANGYYQEISPRNFSTNNFEYKVTAEDGITTKTYSVTVNTYSSNANEMLNFKFGSMVSSTYSGPDGVGIYAINVVMPFNTSLTSLVPLFDLTGSSVTYGATSTAGNSFTNNGLTQLDFRSPVYFKVIAANNDERIYKVIVSVRHATTTAYISARDTNKVYLCDIDLGTHFSSRLTERSVTYCRDSGINFISPTQIIIQDGFIFVGSLGSNIKRCNLINNVDNIRALNNCKTINTGFVSTIDIKIYDGKFFILDSFGKKIGKCNYDFPSGDISGCIDIGVVNLSNSDDMPLSFAFFDHTAIITVGNSGVNGWHTAIRIFNFTYSSTETLPNQFNGLRLNYEAENLTTSYQGKLDIVSLNDYSYDHTYFFIPNPSENTTIKRCIPVFRSNHEDLSCNSSITVQNDTSNISMVKYFNSKLFLLSEFNERISACNVNVQDGSLSGCDIIMTKAKITGISTQIPRTTFQSIAFDIIN